MTRIAAVFILLPVIALRALAQEGIVSYVEADGEATIFAPPSHAEFIVEFVNAPAGKQADGIEPGPLSNAASTSAVEASVAAFRKSLNDLDLHPVEFEVSTPAVRDAAAAKVSSVARLRFSVAGFANPDTGPGQFADLCDKLNGAAKGAGAAVTGPVFEVDDKEALIRNAATQATTNAYPAGDAIALALSGRIEYVEMVKVNEIVWNRKFEDKVIEPNLKQVSCTAKVRVTYAVRVAQP